MKQKRYIKIITFAAMLLMFMVSGFLYACSDRGSEVRAVEEGLTETSSLSLTENISSISNNDFSQDIFYVYVCGYVNNPGVYELSEESRIFEAIHEAGGPTEDAWLEALNLAEKVYDGQKIYVPSYDEYLEGLSGNGAYTEEYRADTSQTQNGLVNINTAGIEELITLPGIGEARAQAIIDYREQNGAYTAIEDIMNVSGIKESAFNKIKKYICTR